MSGEAEAPEPSPPPEHDDIVDGGLLTPREAQQEWDEVPVDDDGSMSLIGHLDELRTRIIQSLLTIFAGACAAYGFSEQILMAITRTAPPGQQFVYLSPTEAFFTHLSVSFYTGLLVAAPFLIYQVWAFIRPGLTRQERFATKLLFPVITVFFFGGAFFAYSMILPIGLEFLLSFSGPNLTATLSISAYSTFVLTFLMVFGAAFELPVVIFFAARAGLVDVEDLRAYRAHFVVSLVTLAAVLTPPDVVTQLLLAIPIWLLYEATIVLLRVLP